MNEISIRYAVWITRKSGKGFFAIGTGGPFLAWQRGTAQKFLGELRTQGVGTVKGSKVVKVRVTVETI